MRLIFSVSAFCSARRTSIRRKGGAPRKWIEVQSVEGYKVEQRTMSTVMRRKVARKTARGGGKAREIESRTRSESKKKRGGT